MMIFGRKDNYRRRSADAPQPTGASYALHNVGRLVANVLLVYVCYTVCRLLFVWTNSDLYHDMTFGHLLHLLKAGLVFDSSAICYTNSVVMLMFLLPLHVKEQSVWYKLARWMYVTVNAVCIAANLCDAVYFPYTGKRTTMSVLQEFGNEGAGQMMNIFGSYALTHWYLVLAFLVVVAVLWYGFRAPVFSQRRYNTGSDLLGYYGTQTVALAACGVLCLGLMRGGWTTATRPITLSNANQYVDTPAEAGIVLNTPFSLIRTINKKAFVNPQYMSGEEAQSLFNPKHDPQETLRSLEPLESLESLECIDSLPKGWSLDTTNSHFAGRGKGMNVVVLIMESFSKQHIGFYNKTHDENGATGEKQTFTPFLDSLIVSGALTFRHSYSNGRKSIEGMPSVLSSIPNFVEPFFLTPASMNSLSGLARELTEHKGYSSAFFHGAENGSMGFEAFAHSTGFAQYFGRTEYGTDSHYGGDADFDGTWAIWDEPFLQFYCDRMGEMKQPFVTSVFTASSHSPFVVPDEYKGRFPQGKEPLQECVAYSDNALRLFFAKASKQPWFGNTIFVITSDHTSSHYDPFYTTTLGQYSVPLIFYAPGIDGLRGYDDSTVVQQTDIMPTVLSLLGYDVPYIAFGQDILTTPRSDKFALHWLPETSMYEMVYGSHAVQFDGTNVTAVYDYLVDPLQRTNLKGKADATHAERLTKAVVQQYMQRMIGDSLVVKHE